MNYEDYTGKSIDQSFANFHVDNPEVYKLFKQFFNRWKASGKTKASAKQIIGIIRWDVAIRTQTDDYKINDIYTSCYARLFTFEYPQYEDYFEIRGLRRDGLINQAWFKSALLRNEMPVQATLF